jgi:hypothetical protein
MVFMVKPMAYRKLVRLLAAAGFTSTPGRGDHEKWIAPSGRHVTITRSREISSGVTARALKAIAEEEAR